jgi:hypothetical protein
VRHSAVKTPCDGLKKSYRLSLFGFRSLADVSGGCDYQDHPEFRCRIQLGTLFYVSCCSQRLPFELQLSQSRLVCSRSRPGCVTCANFSSERCFVRVAAHKHCFLSFNCLNLDSMFNALKSRLTPKRHVHDTANYRSRGRSVLADTLNTCGISRGVFRMEECPIAFGSHSPSYLHS